MTVEEFLAARRVPEPPPRPTRPARTAWQATAKGRPHVIVCRCGSHSAVWGEAEVPRHWQRLASGIVRCPRCR